MSEVKSKKREYLVHIKQSWCKGCYLCLEVCPIEGIFHIQEQVSDQGFRPVTVKNEDECTGCKMCELLCPDLAIIVIEKKDKI